MAPALQLYNIQQDALQMNGEVLYQLFKHNEKHIETGRGLITHTSGIIRHCNYSVTTAIREPTHTGSLH